jgi:non-homologous end joining protein Ku
MPQSPLRSKPGSLAKLLAKWRASCSVSVRASEDAELVQAKVEQRAPSVEIETEKREAQRVVNIMDALKKSMQAKG